MELAQWYEKELRFVTTEMSHTLNGRMKPELHSCSAEKKSVILRFPLQDWEVNGINSLHGGISSAMLDFTMSIVVHGNVQGAIPPTISMSTNYLKPVPMNDFCLVEAELTSLGRKNATAFAKLIIPETGKCAATAIGTYAVIKAE